MDKIIERSNQEVDRLRTDPEYRERGYYSEDKHRDDDYYKRKKKRGFFGDMFEFD